ncbi:dihydrolipoyl dehydrogenase [Peribacillus sp. NJ4]|uniref:dihydrolipoyl dehydrogenase n=1 Tax=Peribacillus sp. NJ4 TaxID=3055862 RepID=UPI0025A14E5A|nr:dihydrolipoyl dehydrogenase [Peribacillus sp. NJ4]MDM5212518.1 dihydrolipoyl dehydrogenase [Peribacillus sp. NJ4]
MNQQYDVVIIGGGTGGYVAAIRASQLGLKTAVVEQGKLGGTCLHAGCIPSKALLRSAEVYSNAKNADKFGVIAPEVGLDFSKVQARKEEITERLYKGVQHLMKKGKIDVLEGKGSILQSKDVLVRLNNDERETILNPRNILIATGSRPRTLPGLEADSEYVMTSDEALQMKELPNSIIIVGGGVIGIEWASMLIDFGLEVTVIEYAERILPTEDKDISKEVQRLMKKKGVKIVTGAKVLPESLEKGEGVSIKAEYKGKDTTFSAEKLLVSVGRLANIEGIHLENTKVEVERVIQTNEYYQTNEPNIYAIGDVIGGLQLAHVASHEGIIAIEHMAGENPLPLDQSLVSKCIYSNPEVASVGLTEEDAREKGYQVKTGKFSFRAIGKALVFGESDGFVKLVVEEESCKLLGAHMVGPHVTDMISEAGLARVLNATAMDIAHTIHPHPTLAEAIGEAALAVYDKEIHA